MLPSSLRVVIVSENASTRMGGEAILPWQYFRRLRARGVEAWLVAHERTRAELEGLLPSEVARMSFARDGVAQQRLWQVVDKLPTRFGENTAGFAAHVATQVQQRRIVRDLIARHGIDVIHEPTPVSPKQPSFMYGLGTPVVIGPMNGNLDLPPGFSADARGMGRELGGRALLRGARTAADGMNVVLRGKRDAALLLVANERTRRALPRGVDQSRVIELVENGVDLALFAPRAAEQAAARERERARGAPATFAFVGRIVDWKRVDLLIDAFAGVRGAHRLAILGDGPLRPTLEAHARARGVGERVTFHGFVSQAQASSILDGCDALALPSVRECGGAVVLEAMAKSLPVVATRWGGPVDYLDERSGILVEPTNPTAFVGGFRDALQRLADDPELCRRMGEAGRARVVAAFDWERKIDRMLDIYAQARAMPRAA